MRTMLALSLVLAATGCAIDPMDEIGSRSLAVSTLGLDQAALKVLDTAAIQKLTQLKEDETSRFILVLREENSYEDGRPPTFGSFDGATGVVTKNGVRIVDLVKDADERQFISRSRLKANVSRRADALDRLLKSGLIEIDDETRAKFEDSLDWPVVELSRELVVGLASKGRSFLRGIELFVPHETATLATALSDLSVNPGYQSYSNGEDGYVYMSDNGCPAASEIPGSSANYTRIYGTYSVHGDLVASVLRATAYQTHIYCRENQVLPHASDLVNYKFYLNNHSHGGGADDYDSTSEAYDNYVYDQDRLTVVSAGNANKILKTAMGLNALTVGNYTDSTDSYTAGSGYIDPANTRNMKPEVSAPGESIGPITTSNGIEYPGGTSIAAPFVSGVASLFLAEFPFLRWRPAVLKAMIMAGASDSISGGRSKVGVGGVDAMQSGFDGSSWWWDAGNSDWAWLTTQDDMPSSPYLEFYFSVASTAYSNIRVVVSWLTRGTYTYDHRNDDYPLGIDMDMSVYAPGGASMGSSQNRYNSFEEVNFEPTATGTYRVKISRPNNRDTSCRLIGGVWVDRQW